MCAARHPDRVAGLVLADTYTPSLLSRWERLQRSVLLRAAVPPVRVVGYERIERALVCLQERIPGEGVSGDYERIDRLRARGPRMATDEFAEVVRALAAFHRTEVDRSAIAAPTPVLHGEHEGGFVRTSRARTGRCGPRRRRPGVPDAGHASTLDDPAFFDRALAAFLADVSPRDRRTRPAEPGDGAA